MVELVNQSKEKDCEDLCTLSMMCIGGSMCGSPREIPSYGQVLGRSVLSRECLCTDGYILRWPSVVLSWLRIGRYVAETIRQLPLTAGPSLSRKYQQLILSFHRSASVSIAIKINHSHHASTASQNLSVETKKPKCLLLAAPSLCIRISTNPLCSAR